MEGGPSAPCAGKVLAFLAACLLLCVAEGATRFRYCDKQADYAVKVKGVKINPDPVVRGEPATFKISAVADGAVTGGKLVIDVKYFGIHVHQESRELCDETSCPVSGGDFVLSHDQTLPSYTPPGRYTLTMKMLGQDGNQLSCIMFDFTIKIGSPLADS